MLPTIISREIEEGIKSFLRTTFPPATPAFEHTLDTFLEEPGRVFRGPYYALRLPFRPAAATALPFEEISFPYRPHLHQAKAFERLCGDTPRSTLVATGTGSGKTECFLYPILDACAAHAGQPGIKAIVIYPMNALATDQAKRFAKAIHADEKLRGRVRAGLFIGGEGDQTDEMTPEWPITNKDAMRENPPDILLTNYKMLDYLLLRPDEQILWQHNGPETLRYLVVDELHTFDGAQATDLACLLRRLKARLRTPEGYLCCVGTSATLGSSGAAGPLVDYARTVFAEPFDGADCVIGEDLLTLSDVVEGHFIRFHGVPSPDELTDVIAEQEKAPEEFLAAQYRLWFEKDAAASLSEIEERVALGEKLREHSFFRNLLTLVERSGRKILAEEWLAHELGQMVGVTVNDPGGIASIRRLLDSFLSLCAHARFRTPGFDKDSKSGAVGPLLRVHVHLWTRELSRLTASVEEKPRLVFSDDLKEDAPKGHLPLLHCRECGTMGWGGTMRANADRVSADLQDFYKAFFGHLPSLRFFFPVGTDDGAGRGQIEFTYRLCGRCLGVNASDAAKCTRCSATEGLIHVRMHDRTRRVNDETQADTACPFCESRSGLTIVGSRAASLTSVALGQLYASPFNRDKQALAFSDNVQDASHRSGFFAARTYRLNLRTAMAKVIAAADGEPLRLADIAPRFIDFWKHKLGALDFVGSFLPPNMESLDEYETLRREGTLPREAQIVRQVERRTDWEITAEFGFNSRIGRTLEKTGSAIAYVDPALVQRAADRLLNSLRERTGGFGSLPPDQARMLLAGLIHRLRTNGGIYHAELDSYVAQGGNTYLLNREAHMPGFRAEAPAFFTMGSGRASKFEKLVASGAALSWSQRWAVKALKAISGLSAESAAIVLEEAVRALMEENIFVEQSAEGNRVWGLPGERLFIAAEVRQMSCRECGHSNSCAPVEETLWAGAPCLRSGCLGEYVLQPAARDYYGDRYRTGDVVRIRSAEHTGLLSREAREWVESRFMARPPERRVTDPNLLSCTPTLEMGVNIGDLSSVVLCTVPPATSNYVQRVGRAGRTFGSAISLTIASAQPHDLYFFELPEDMMAGEIRPPGTFLNAPAVLERQLTAYCIDRWSEQVHPKPILPHFLGPVLDVVRSPEGKTGFPYDFFRYIENNLQTLLPGFLSLFRNNELTSESRETLEGFAHGDRSTDGLTIKILKRLERISLEREDLRARLKRTGKAIRRNRDTAARDEALEEELAQLLQHRDGIHEMLKQLQSKLTLNFFTDEGLLPNYAFPEEGVELRSVILKRREQPKAEEGKYRTETYEYVRPAASAITELAPGNVFYVQGRRLKVDQVGLGVSRVEPWHFCDSCSYMEPVESAPQRSECPACGSPNWIDASLKRELLRLRQVISTVIDEKARSHDDKDERDLEFYNRHESVVIPEESERRAFQIPGAMVPFGFEFLGRLLLRVVNLGQDSPEIHAYRLGGREVASGGFTMCPDCGKVQGRRSARGEAEMKHDLSCRRRGQDAAPLRAVFLYRELHSEAIRVLLPSAGAEEDSDMASFVAALHLGLRLYFKGGIEHLQGCVDERPVPGTSLRRKYLVLFDQVPGGTGYLKELSRAPEAFLEVLRGALRHLKDCECATRDDHETDGCHRCILQSSHRRNRRGGLSRTTAIRLLETILEHADQLEEVERVSDIDIHPLIQSELEKAFLDGLRTVPGAQLQAKVVRGKPGFLWRCGDAAWEIGLQVAVPAGIQVDVPSIPDFVLYPVRSETSRPVAIFLDGFAFHADEAAGRNRIARDVQQRQALVRSGKFWVWSFSWEDIQFRNDPAKILATPFGEAQAGRRDDLARQVLSNPDLGIAQSAAGYSSWSLFLEFLGRPAAQLWQAISYLYALMLPTQLTSLRLEGGAAVIDALCQNASELPSLAGGAADGVGGVFIQEPLVAVTFTTLKGVKEKSPAGVFSLVRFDDDTALLEPDFPKHWKGFLRLMNRLQFLPHGYVITKRGCKAGLFPGITDAYHYFLAGGEQPASNVGSEEQSDLRAALEVTVPSIHGLLGRIHRDKLQWPEIGFELHEGGRVVATSELAWPDARLAVIDLELTEEREAFLCHEWQVFSFTSGGISDTDTNLLIEKLRAL